MKTKFKLLTCVIAAAVLSTGAIAAVLSTGAAAAASTNSGFIFTDSSPILTAEDKVRMEAAELRSTPEWRDAFQEALLEGKSPVDPVCAADKEVIDIGKIMPVYLEPASSVFTDIKLELVHDDSGNYSYNLWSGRFIVPDVRGFAGTFYGPETFGCGFDNNYKNGRAVAVMKGRPDYSRNYKSAYVKEIYNKDRERYTEMAENNGTTQVVSAVLNGSGGELVEGAYYFYLHDGTGSGSEYNDVVVIHVVDKDYAASSEYAAKPYAGLIDHYTYVDTGNMGAVPPINAE